MSTFSLFINQIKYSWSQKFGLQITTLFVLTGAFLVVSFSFFIGTNIKGTLDKVGQDVRVSVYLNTDKAEGVSRIESILKGSNYFDNIKFVEKSESLSKFKEKMKKIIPSFEISDAAKNPLPSIFQMKIKSIYRTEEKLQDLEAMVADLINQDEIEDVLYSRAFLKKYTSFLNVYGSLSLGFIALLFTCVFLIIGNMSKTSVSMRREEIEVLELVGATRSYIRTPFILEGAFMGLISSALALGFSFIVFHYIELFVKNNFDPKFLYFKFTNLDWTLSILIVLSGVLIGALGAGLSVSKVNSGWAATEG